MTGGPQPKRIVLCFDGTSNQIGADYVAKVQAAVDELIRDRLMLQEDADRYLEKAHSEARVNP